MHGRYEQIGRELIAEPSSLFSPELRPTFICTTNEKSHGESRWLLHFLNLRAQHVSTWQQIQDTPRNL